MDNLVIEGGASLRGEVEISGAKNAVLPIMAAALLTEEPCVIRRAPNLRDVRFMGGILQSLGAEVQFEEDCLRIHAARIHGKGDYNLIRKMRGSVCIMGPLLGRLGEATVSLPGGCVIGTRPIDLHLKGLKALGAEVDVKEGYVQVRAKRLRGGSIFLGGRMGPTVLGTANVMMAATLGEGETVIDSAACEPEIIDLADFLTSMGADIEGIGSPRITIRGVERLGGVDHEVIPDRIEAATFAMAAAATGGDVRIRRMRCDHIGAVLDKLDEAGVNLVQTPGTLHVTGDRGSFLPVDVTTQPYAGYPTDAQAQLMTLMTLSEGISIITERIFESRFMHVSELLRLGADITIEGTSAIVKGPSFLSGAPVMASDLRASAALVIAGLMAKGKTRVKRIYHLDRGYENIDRKIEQLGGRVVREKEP